MNIKIVKGNVLKQSKKLINGFRLRRYYSENSRTGKTYMAIILDKLILRVIAFIGFILIFYFISESILFSIIISIQIFILYNFILYKINKSRMQRKMDIVNQQVVLKKTHKELLNQTPQDFLDYIINVLEKYGFDSITRVNGKELDLIGIISDRKIGIKCLQYDNDYKVGVDIIRDFYVGLRNHELSEGAIITASSFSLDAENLLAKLKKYAHIQLVDIEGLLEIMKKADLYPSEKEIKKIMLDEVSDNRLNFKRYKDVVLSRGKIIKYILLGISLIIFGRFTPYSTYYNIVAIIIFFMAVASLIVLIVSLFKVNEEKHENKVL
ncbi:hypothetical protein DW1_1615 [Proteiniborus sp. DW1]|uniref:restriction endonuclease n=1 Tax=Proteiniborus sp. DW1 TaxID=1889883 RepID=UPI00092DEB5C|nr:restriction endonuclease [Proteiniborus sp. DW1]SCG83185.1 hypothetical protein DW1_1615 [Proteiniborus sp. DW1]